MTGKATCGRCNHGLAHLDQALIGDLEIFATLAGVPRKRGRPPKVSSYGNLKADVKEGHLNAYFNMDPTPVATPDGQRLGAYRGKPRDVAAQFAQEGTQGTITFDISFGKSPKVARALVKMGAEYFCYAQGRQLASDVIAGSVSDFVRFGRGDRPLILGPAEDVSYRHWFGQIHRISDDGWYCIFRLAHFEVLVDLSPRGTVFEIMAARMFDRHGGKGWSTLPPDAFHPTLTEPL